MNLGLFRMDLQRDEGLRLKPYMDTVGKLTIGYGRNLSDVGISENEANFLLTSDIATVVEECQGQIWWPAVERDDVRSRALANMVFNMGLPTFNQFHNLIEAVRLMDWQSAAHEIENSLWYRQVGERGVRIATMMRTGQDA